jgi:hypothetical protein
MSPLFTLIVIIILASTVSSVAKAIFGYRGRRLPGVDRELLQRLESGMSEMREQIGAVREEVAELYERVDFTERMLARQRDDMWQAGRLGGPAGQDQRDLST